MIQTFRQIWERYVSDVKMQNTVQLQSGSVFTERPLTPQSDGLPISNTPAPRWLQRWWFMPSTRDHTKSCCRLVSCISAPDHISMGPTDHETVKVSLEPALPLLVHFTINNPLVTFRTVPSASDTVALVTGAAERQLWSSENPSPPVAG